MVRATAVSADATAADARAAGAGTYFASIWWEQGRDPRSGYSCTRKTDILSDAGRGTSGISRPTDAGCAFVSTGVTIRTLCPDLHWLFRTISPWSAYARRNHCRLQQNNHALRVWRSRLPHGPRLHKGFDNLKGTSPRAAALSQVGRLNQMNLPTPHLQPTHGPSVRLGPAKKG